MAPCLVGLVFATAGGSTVVPMNLRTLADLSGQVIVADVASMRSYWAENPRRIETEITFTGVQYLKGRRAGAGDNFTLVVPGGKVGDMQLRLCCAPEFHVGDRRLLFLLPTYKTFPTVGLDQGSFQIIKDANGAERVYQDANTPVTGIDADGYVTTSRAIDSSVLAHQHEANGVRVQPGVNSDGLTRHSSADSKDGALSLADFLRFVQPILDASVNHHMSEPAGKRILVELRAVPFKTLSDGAASGASSTNSKMDAASKLRTSRSDSATKSAADGHKRSTPAVPESNAPRAEQQGGGR